MSKTEQIEKEEEKEELEQQNEEQEEALGNFDALTDETKHTIETVKKMTYPQLREFYLRNERVVNEFLIFTRKTMIVLMEEALEREGYPMKEIIEKVVKDLTAGKLTTEDYIRKVSPEKYKNPKKVAAGKKIMKEKIDKQKRESLPNIMPELEQIEEEPDKEGVILLQSNLSPTVQYSQKYVKDLESKIDELENKLQSSNVVTMVKLDKTRAAQLQHATKTCKENIFIYLDAYKNCVKIKPDTEAN